MRAGIQTSERKGERVNGLRVLSAWKRMVS
jgi:hypothetical protein